VSWLSNISKNLLNLFEFAGILIDHCCVVQAAWLPAIAAAGGLRSLGCLALGLYRPEGGNFYHESAGQGPIVDVPQYRLHCSWHNPLEPEQ
jgi:hypothetical protein